MTVIDIKDLYKIYGEQKALDNVSLCAHEGEIVGLLGPNGAGKSTMMKIISCFIPPTSGKVSVCGMDVMEESDKIKSLIGYLPEQNPLYNDMYVRESISFAASIHGVKKLNRKQRVEEMVDLVGLRKEVNKKISQLSKGYKQRVGLACAMVHNPKVLILDEPTTGLDPNQIVEIREIIKEIGKNKTIILSTHIMQEVEAVCTRAVIINNGKLVADDSVEHLAKGGSLEKAFVQLTKGESAF